jgi:hypothetical protein
MEQALLELGARPEKTHYVPNGVDADRFRAGAPAEASPTFLSVAEKKGPQLTIAETVIFLGAQPHEVVAEEMRRARAFVQHSVVASDGNNETMPNAILEASASGLPVVATRHAGIPEVVVNGETASWSRNATSKPWPGRWRGSFWNLKWRRSSGGQGEGECKRASRSSRESPACGRSSEQPQGQHDSLTTQRRASRASYRAIEHVR